MWQCNIVHALFCMLTEMSAVLGVLEDLALSKNAETARAELQGGKTSKTPSDEHRMGSFCRRHTRHVVAPPPRLFDRNWCMAWNRLFSSWGKRLGRRLASNPKFQTADTSSHPRGALRPSCMVVPPFLRRGCKEGRAPAGTRGPCAEEMHTQCTGEIRWSRKQPAFPAQWLYGLYRAHLGDEFFLSPSLRESTAIIDPVGLMLPPQSLTAATAARSTRFCRTN